MPRRLGPQAGWRCHWPRGKHGRGRGRGREAGLGERPPHSCAPTPAPRALIRSRPGAVLDDPDESRQAPGVQAWSHLGGAAASSASGDESWRLTPGWPPGAWQIRDQAWELPAWTWDFWSTLYKLNDLRRVSQPPLHHLSHEGGKNRTHIFELL